jgi:hypothetical protein
MSTGSHKYLVTKIYRYGRRRYKKKWYRKKSKDKRGFMRYSTGSKWSEQYDPYKPAFWRTYQPEHGNKLDPDDMLPSGYTRNQTWTALCKSWNGFLLAKRECDRENMKQYAMQIRKLQKELDLPQSEFDMFTSEEMEWIERESDDSLNELRYAMSVPEF